MNVPKYATSLTRADWEEIRRATRPVVGRGIKITKDADTVKFEIDIAELKRIIWSFNANGGFQAAYGGLDNISVDGPSS